MVAGHRIERLIGEGGMAAVYEAHQVSLNRDVALKILAQRVGADPSFQDRFWRECKAQARLDHPNIVPIYAADGSDYGLWLAMRLVKGPTLREILNKEKLDPERVLELLTPIAEALDVAHEHDLIHRDITPQNILVEDRHPFLADFGITKGRRDRSLTRTGQFLGTLDYVAPEQIEDQPTGAATDVYSLAAILFECLAGRVPFDKGSEYAVLFAHVHEDPPQVTALDHALPEAIDLVLAKGLAKLPADRYGSASDLLNAAEGALKAPTPAPAPLPPPAPAGASTASEPERRRIGRRLLALGSVALLLAVAALGLGAISSDSSSPKPARASTGALEVDLPAHWTATKSEQSGIPGLPLENPLVMKPRDPSGGESVVVGVSPATGKTLLPPDLQPALGGPLRGTPVSLGALEALRYRELRTPGLGDPLAVFTSPTSAGVATVACRPDGRGSELFELCARLASTLELERGDAFPLGPSPELAKALRRQVAILGERRSTLRRRLGTASGADRQAAIASELAAAFRRAAHGLSGREITPQSAAGLAGVVESLRATRDAYKGLATAARHENRTAYRGAAVEVAQGEAAVDRRLLALRELGYRVGLSG